MSVLRALALSFIVCGVIAAWIALFVVLHR